MSESDSDSSSGSSDAAARFLPKSQKGWGGGDLEMEHQRESFRQQKKGAAAVDISQFQNTEVGKGYQAKHVVRQRGLQHHDLSGQQKQQTTADLVFQDTGGSSGTRAKEEKEESKSSSRNKKRKERGSDSIKEEERKPRRRKDTHKTRLEKYLACAGMRNFRREIEEMLS